MSALQKIKTAGFILKLLGESFEVAPASALTDKQRAFLKNHKAEIIEELKQEQSANDVGGDNEVKIRAWLNHIGEDNKTIIDDVLARCQDDADCIAYFLKRSCP